MKSCISIENVCISTVALLGQLPANDLGKAVGFKGLGPWHHVGDLDETSD